MARVRSYLRRDGTRVRAHRRRGQRRTISRRPPVRRSAPRRSPRRRSPPLPAGRLGLLLLGGVIVYWLIAAIASFVDGHPMLSTLVVFAVAAAGLAALFALRRARARWTAEAAARARFIEVTDPMTGPQFERWVADLLGASGFTRVRVCGRSADRGADVVAVAPDGRRTVVQCKRHAGSNPVGSAAIQRFAGTCRSVHHGELCMIITNGRFTVGDGAALARELDIVLVDRVRLADWAYRHTVPAEIGSFPETVRRAA